MKKVSSKLVVSSSPTSLSGRSEARNSDDFSRHATYSELTLPENRSSAKSGPVPRYLGPLPPAPHREQHMNHSFWIALALSRIVARLTFHRFFGV
jgi:hypothetical protein